MHIKNVYILTKGRQNWQERICILIIINLFESICRFGFDIRFVRFKYIQRLLHILVVNFLESPYTFNIMKMNLRPLFRILILALSGLSISSLSESQVKSKGIMGKSEWIFMNPEGKLVNKKTERGDRIMDFSYAGYMGGGVAIPDVPVVVTVTPSGSDDTENIQDAVNKVSGMQLKGNFRGAVLLAPGDYTISKTITISADGVILKGSGSGMSSEKNSTINLTGKPFNAITLRLASNVRADQNKDEINSNIRTTITDSYVPSGSSEFSVANAELFNVGDVILIHKPVTSKWVQFMQMHDLVRDGKPQTWLKVGSFLDTERSITKISGKTIHIDVPLSDSYDSELLKPVKIIVEKINPPKRLRQSGVENLHIVSPSQPIAHTVPHFTALRINGEDCWARDILIEETMNSINVGGKRITVENVTVQRKALHQGSSRPAGFAPNGSQVLIDRCKVIADNVWFVATGSGQSGPIVILNCEFTGDQRAESHQRWSTGMLYDNVRAENGGIDFRNRGSMGSGHGWSMGWGVAWNCKAKDYVIQNPPGAMNWMIGCIGESRLMPRPFDKEPLLPEGIKESPGIHVSPQSIYLAQLKERLGIEALRNIGYE